jgi:hypothetical protein
MLAAPRTGYVPKITLLRRWHRTCCNRPAMRALALVAVVLLPSCTLYFGDGGDDAPYPVEPDPFPPDAAVLPPDPDPVGLFARCEDGKRYVTQGGAGPHDTPGHGLGTPAGSCPGGCRSAVVECLGNDCTNALAALCTTAATTGASCALQGTTCSGTATAGCAQTSTCGQALDGGSCTCSGSKYACTNTPAMAAVHAKLVGKWKGTATTPWVAPYPVSIWIYPDGTYWAECTTTAYCNAFYYGGDGPHPWRRIKLLSASDTLGAWADIGVFTSFNIGAISSLFVNDTTLTFTFNASWHNCSQPITYSLTRE